jgi:hypothetical protein
LVGSAGLGYEPGSVSELTRRLAQLLGHPGLRRALAVSASACGAGFDWTAIAERVLRFAIGASAQAFATRAAPLSSASVGRT